MRVISGRCRLPTLARVGGAVLLAAGLWASPSVAADRLGTLRLHKAVYALEFAPGDRRVAASVTGQMGFELTRDCREWTMIGPLALVIEAEGQRLELQSRSEVREALDGSRMEERSEVTSNGQVIDRKSMTAQRRSDGNFDVRLNDKALRLPGDALMPIQLSIASFQSLAAGKSTMTARTVQAQYPGFEVVIRAGVERAAAPSLHRGDGLPDARVWPFRLAFFDPGNPTGLPASEVSGVAGVSGVTQELLVDAGGIRLRAVLTALQLLPDPKC